MKAGSSDDFCCLSEQNPHRVGVTVRAQCPGARTELSFLVGGTALVGCCGDEKPFHPAVFQPRSACL